MRSLALRIVILWGWRRVVVAILAGALAALSMPPVGAFPVLFVAFPVLVWLLDGAPGERGGLMPGALTAALIGWCFGFGYFAVGLHWVGEAFLVDAETFGWMLPLVLLGFPAGLAIFTALACALTMIAWSPGFGRILALSAVWAAAEWLRGTVLTGFPWNAVGYAFAPSDMMIQTASLWGLYGLSFLVVFVVSSPATLADEYEGGQSETARRWLGPAAMLAAVLAAAVFGYLRLGSASVTAVEGVHLRIVQPNIPQAEKWKPENRNPIFARYLELSNRATSPETMGIEDVTHLIWPESAVPFLLARTPDAMASIAALLPEGSRLLTGALRRPDGAAARVYNSLFVIDADGRIESVYDKSHLVPFGEYLPLEDVLKPLGLRKLVAMPLGFAAGPGRASVPAGKAPAFSPLICYEAIFPGKTVLRDDRPGWLLNVTNDAWFGESIGPHQHYQQARLRAVEEGLPLVRAANTGISAVIDPYGRMMKRLELGTSGVLDSRLPQALEPTLYARYGDLVAFVLMAIGLVFGMIARLSGR